MEAPAERPALTLVIPIYNERENLEPLVLELQETLAPRAVAAEIILVNDGSDDGSAEEISRLVQRHANVRALHFRKNRGQSAAFDAGFKKARGAVVATLDADLQNDPRDLFTLIDALADHDVAVGYRARRADTWIRRVSSRVANAVRNALSGDDIIDTGCSLKAFRRESLAGLKLYRGMHRFLPTLLRIEGYRVVQLPVNHRPRRAGASKYGIANRLFSSFADLLAVRWMKKRRLDYEVVRDEP